MIDVDEDAGRPCTKDRVAQLRVDQSGRRGGQSDVITYPHDYAEMLATAIACHPAATGTALPTPMCSCRYQAVALLIPSRIGTAGS
jgi:hypothetical protein